MDSPTPEDDEEPRRQSSQSVFDQLFKWLTALLNQLHFVVELYSALQAQHTAQANSPRLSLSIPNLRYFNESFYTHFPT